MASHTLTAPDRFPASTTVTVYPRSNWPGTPAAWAGAAPVGSSTTSGTTDANGSVTFTGLADGTDYLAYAQVNSQDRYVAFTTRHATSVSTVDTSGASQGFVPVWDGSKLSVGEAGLYDAVTHTGLAAGNAAAVNDTALATAMTAAANGGYRGVFVRASGSGAANYQFSAPVSPTSGVDIVGEYTIGKSALNAHGGTVFQGTDPTKHVIQLPHARNGFEYAGIRLTGLRLKGGLDGINADNGIGNLYLDHVFADANAGNGIWLQGQVQDLVAGTVIASGCGGYGVGYEGNGGVVNSTNPFFDKSQFDDLKVDGCAKQGLYINAVTANTLRFELLRASHNAFDGCYFAGGIRSLIIDAYNSEYNAYQSTGARKARTTGGIASGSNSLLLASAVGFSVGDLLTIRGAGVNAIDLQAYIGSSWDGSSTTIPLTQVNGSTVLNASNGVSNADVTNAIYSDMVFATGHAASPGYVEIRGYYGGQDLSGGPVTANSRYRYAIDNQSGNKVVLSGTTLKAGDAAVNLNDPAGTLSMYAMHPFDKPTVRRGKAVATLARRAGRSSWEPTTAVAHNLAPVSRLDDTGSLVSGTLYLAGGMTIPAGYVINNLGLLWSSTTPTTTTHLWAIVFDTLNNAPNNILFRTGDITSNPSASVRQIIPVAWDAANAAIRSYQANVDTDVFVAVCWQGTGTPKITGLSSGGTAAFFGDTLPKKSYSANTALSGDATTFTTLSGASQISWVADVILT